MRKLKVWASKVLAGAMAVACFVGTTPLYSRAAADETAVTISATDSGVQYVALGDSITIGDSSYVSKVSSYLKSSYGACTTKNLAVDGWQSGDLLDALTNSKNAKYYTMRSAIKNADIITIDIGSNDIMQTAMEVISDCFACDESQLGDVTASWSEKLSNATGLQLYWIYLQAMVIARNINYQLNYGTKMQTAMTKFDANFKEIMTQIKKLAPNAKIYIGNIYNPYVGSPSLYVGNYEVINVEKFAKTYVVKANTTIKKYATGCVIVDLYNTINNAKYIKGDLANYIFDPHPNATGQTAIANKFIASIKANK